MRPCMNINSMYIILAGRMAAPRCTVYIRLDVRCTRRRILPLQSLIVVVVLCHLPPSAGACVHHCRCCKAGRVCGRRRRERTKGKVGECSVASCCGLPACLEQQQTRAVTICHRLPVAVELGLWSAAARARKARREGRVKPRRTVASPTAPQGQSCSSSRGLECGCSTISTQHAVWYEQPPAPPRRQPRRRSTMC